MIQSYFHKANFNRRGSGLIISSFSLGGRIILLTQSLSDEQHMVGRWPWCLGCFLLCSHWVGQRRTQSHWPAASSLQTGRDLATHWTGDRPCQPDCPQQQLTATGRSTGPGRERPRHAPLLTKGTHTPGPQRMFPALDHFSEIRKYNQHIKYRGVKTTD